MSMHPPARSIILWSGVLLWIGMSVGCNFDAERQYNIRFPATLIIMNQTTETIAIDQIRSNPEAESTFMLPGGILEPGKSRRLRIAERDYRVILAGDFTLHCVCGDKAPRELPGIKLSRIGVYDAQRWDVTVSISQCGGNKESHFKSRTETF